MVDAEVLGTLQKKLIDSGSPLVIYYEDQRWCLYEPSGEELVEQFESFAELRVAVSAIVGEIANLT